MEGVLEVTFPVRELQLRAQGFQWAAVTSLGCSIKQTLRAD